MKLINYVKCAMASCILLMLAQTVHGQKALPVPKQSTTGQNTQPTTPKQSTGVRTRLEVSSGVIVFLPPGGQRIKVTVDSNVDWDISYPDWCLCTKESGSFVVSCKENTSTQERNGQIRVWTLNGKETRRISVTQKGQTVTDDKRIKISTVQFANIGNGNVIDDYGSQLYNDIAYLRPKITFTNLVAAESRNISLDVKIFNPDGTLKVGTESPQNYSYNDTIFVRANNDPQAEVLSGWGNQDKTSYKVAGKYRVEIYCAGVKMYSAEVDVKARANQSTPAVGTSVAAASVAGKQESAVNLRTSATTVEFPYYSTDKTVTVTTNANAYDIILLPAWCNVTEKNPGNFKIKCESNFNTSSRMDYFMVTAAGGAEVKIYIKQAAYVPPVKNNIAKVKNDYHSVGFSVGYVSKYWKYKLNDGTSGKSGIWDDKPVSGLQAGLRTDFYFSPKVFGLGLSTGLYYEYYRSKSDSQYTEDGDYDLIFQEHSLYLPIHLIYRFDINENVGLYIKGGLGLDCGINAGYKAKELGSGDEFFTSENLYGDTEFGCLKRVNLSGEFGAGLQVNRFIFDVSFSKGLLNQTSSDGYTTTQNKGIIASLAIMF